MISRQVLLNALTVVQSIEETLAAADETDFKTHDEDPPTISDCDLPDHIVDPFELLRILRGDDYVRNIEYVGDIRYIAEIIDSCVNEELRKLGKHSVLDLEETDDE